MFLTETEKTGILLESMERMKRLVEDTRLSPASAFHLIVDQAMNHPAWPKPEQKEAEVVPLTPVRIPEPLVEAPIVEAPIDAEDFL